MSPRALVTIALLVAWTSGCSCSVVPPAPLRDAGARDAPTSIDVDAWSETVPDGGEDARVVIASDASGRDAGWPMVVGVACTDDQACGGGGCYERIEVRSASGTLRGKAEFPGGYCSIACDATPGSCPPSTVCAEVHLYEDAPTGGGLAITALSVLLCAPACADASACRPSYRCLDGACVPPPPTR